MSQQTPSSMPERRKKTRSEQLKFERGLRTACLLMAEDLMFFLQRGSIRSTEIQSIALHHLGHKLSIEFIEGGLVMFVHNWEGSKFSTQFLFELAYFLAESMSEVDAIGTKG